MKSALITGGAGFIGSHLTDELISHGYSVRILDNLLPQVHRSAMTPPECLNPEAKFVYGDVRDAAVVNRSVDGIDAVFHLAASVGVGQSMYEVTHYTSDNSLGTAVLLESLIRHPVEKLIVASSMRIYGKETYRTADGLVGAVVPVSLGLLQAGIWDLPDGDGMPLDPRLLAFSCSRPDWQDAR